MSSCYVTQRVRLGPTRCYATEQACKSNTLVMMMRKGPLCQQSPLLLNLPSQPLQVTHVLRFFTPCVSIGLVQEHAHGSFGKLGKSLESEAKSSGVNHILRNHAIPHLIPPSCVWLHIFKQVPLQRFSVRLLEDLCMGGTWARNIRYRWNREIACCCSVLLLCLRRSARYIYHRDCILLQVHVSVIPTALCKEYIGYNSKYDELSL